MRRLSALLITLALPLSHAQARVTTIDILDTAPAFTGQSFGPSGVYDLVTARVNGVLDPADPRNAIIQDIELAPRGADGLVHYATELQILKPSDQAKGNGILLFEINNRGNKLSLGNFNDGAAPGLDARNSLSSPGDGWLMNQGYTLVWWGWEMDVNPGLHRILMPPVIAHNPDGSPITGPITGIVRSELITPTPVTTIALTRSQQVLAPPDDSYDGYPAAKLDNREPFADGFLPTLTVRAHTQDPRVPVASSAWSFGRCAAGGAPPTPDAKHLCMPSGFKPGLLYELIYRAKDPTVEAIGFAATRDLGDFLTHAPASLGNPVARAGQQAILTGTSQSGRMLRSFLALGFNQAETGRRAFDAALPHIGGGLMPLNVRFGQPYRAWGEQTDHTYPAYDFPFTYGDQQDPLTGRTAGLFDRCTQSDTCPKLFHVATVLEVWEGRQSLGFTDPLGRRDIADPANVRSYILASTQHGPAPVPLAAPGVGNYCQQQSNPNPHTWTLRALLTDLKEWVQHGTEPPPSVTPRIDDGTFVAADQVRFPPIPANDYGGVQRPATVETRVYDTLHVLNFGPHFRPEDESGVITIEPPLVGSASYGVLVPQVDADGNDLGGIRDVFVQAPIGTYTGWNVGRAGWFEGGMCNLQGSYIPFAPTKAAREAAGDPRLSLEERYPTPAAYLAAFRAAADRLVSQRFLLPDDAQRLLGQAEQSGVAAVPWASRP